MQKEATVRFLHHHRGSVRAVAFSPVERYLFCSGANDARVNVYSALHGELLTAFAVSTSGLSRNVNGVRFTSDGKRILASTTARRLVVLEMERGGQVMDFDNCTFNGCDRAGLAVDAGSPYLVACTSVNGKGLTVIDLRVPLPLYFIHNLHSCVTRDVVFLHHTWPWCKGQVALLSASTAGECKVTTLEGRVLDSFRIANSQTNTVSTTPESYSSEPPLGYDSLILTGGMSMTAFQPLSGLKERIDSPSPIWKVRYSSHGGLLYTADEAGSIKCYKRTPDQHELLCELYSHKKEVQDLDISPYDEFVISASKDRSVGLFWVGAPNRGSTQTLALT